MEITLTFGVLTAITISLVQILKSFKIDARINPVFAILIGIGLCALAGIAFPQLIFAGLVMGLTASGLYDVGSKTILGK